MFVFFSKLLPLLVYPLGSASILLILALILHKRRKLQTALIVLSIAVLWLGGSPWISALTLRSLEWRYLPPDPMPWAEAIVVLGGGTDPAEYPRSTTEINGSGDRVLYGALLYKEGKAPLVLLSGGSITFLGKHPSTPAEQMAEIMTWIGVPEDAMVLQPKSQNTYEDALYCAEILKERGIKRIILVTSAFHMPRAVGLFEHQGFMVIPAPTDYKITGQGWDNLVHADFQGMIISLLPDVNDMSLTAVAIKEYIGIAVYSLRGWM